MKKPIKRQAMNNIPDIQYPRNYGNTWKHGTGRMEGGCMGYIIHMFFDDGSGKTLCKRDCGNGIWDGGGLDLTETTPSCKQCRKALVKMGMGKWVDMPMLEKKMNRDTHNKFKP